MKNWIIERLEIFRGETGLTAEDFAERVGISVAYVYKVARRESAPSIEVMDAWLQFCGKNLATFFQPLGHTEKRHAEWAPWHDRLDSILECPEDVTVDRGISIVNGIKLNLIAVAREAERAKRRSLRKKPRDAPSPPLGPEHVEPRAARSQGRIPDTTIQKRKRHAN